MVGPVPAPLGGRVLLLNGTPRSGKSTTARALQVASPTPMIGLGVDLVMASTPPSLLPGIGLRPGGERPDLEPFVRLSYRALFDAIAAHARQGFDVVSDVGIHDGYSQSLGIWREAAARLSGLQVFVVGVRCSLEAVLERRAAQTGRYETGTAGRVPPAVLRWEQAVHDPGWYDLEVDTSRLAPEACADAIVDHLATTTPAALERHRQG